MNEKKLIKERKKERDHRLYLLKLALTVEVLVDVMQQYEKEWNFTLVSQKFRNILIP